MVFPYLTGPIASAAGFRVALAVTAIPAVAYGLLTLLIHARSGKGACLGIGRPKRGRPPRS